MAGHVECRSASDRSGSPALAGPDRKARRMRRKLISSVAFVAQIALSVAAAEKPITVNAGNLGRTFNGGVSPKALAKTKMKLISFNAPNG